MRVIYVFSLMVFATLLALVRAQSAGCQRDICSRVRCAYPVNCLYGIDDPDDCECCHKCADHPFKRIGESCEGFVNKGTCQAGLECYFEDKGIRHIVTPPGVCREAVFTGCQPDICSRVRCANTRNCLYGIENADECGCCQKCADRRLKDIGERCGRFFFQGTCNAGLVCHIENTDVHNIARPSGICIKQYLSYRQYRQIYY